jgi:hypothetical protein
MFIRWGVFIALIGIVLSFTLGRLLLGSLRVGAILTIVGVALYYYGRFARKERIFISRR